ncbi:MAG: hypothetical protein A2504_08850 [Bdellovibrionales bacterium RIFOXYD12_FULL_39_22]|nr:MAG: hypothetical protein A2385_13365 [Bdellovibrionales bacterium RIFOXYB1_FULL_39_21]OFZ40921.1 MAG: hypothetical protein A2485_16380 [Bdellovibrionales bacterium RIFOXYC12_FULL_39_17]OFZ44735.1 MAG: hypothetical protein A2404_10740 [Bdellovibrionales bacterium RIFOXYC1_FULL_39_130]OFZ69676.1 MAG: hypothetical protein A2451_12520 [Bdellovibrionales bacterium RIFOXYC2_FULL_39_8]OFZ74186.1 MAG: hypothetical protein A2560_03405 [Bdellovibrionales bacterium RIFOXYD1_FULL_39_84]OFZ92066.1 MAG:
MEAKTICPMCSAGLKIKVLECSSCQSGLTGNFDFPKGGQLDDEIFNFVKVFIYAEGNIKKTEAILNCSYPKIKNLLKQAKKSLGISEGPGSNSTTPDERKHILNMLDAGEISFDEAMEKIKNSQI